MPSELDQVRLVKQTRMIAHLTGKLFRKTPQSLIVDSGGVGYEVSVPLSTYYGLPEEEERVSLYIYTHVREDCLSLFGFQTLFEKEIFLLLTSVSGIGPKLALNILSGIGPRDLIDAVAGGDSARLQSIPGVGRKTSERIALELREKALRIRGDTAPQPVRMVGPESRRIREDALSALVNLGYPSKTAKPAVDKAALLIGGEDLESLIKESLRLLA